MISGKGKSEYLTNTVSVKEYGYREDTNYPIRGSMEDCSNATIFKLISTLIII